MPVTELPLKLLLVDPTIKTSTQGESMYENKCFYSHYIAALARFNVNSGILHSASAKTDKFQHWVVPHVSMDESEEWEAPPLPASKYQST